MKIKNGLLLILQVVICTGVIMASVFHVSCRITEEGVQVLNGDYTSPQLVSYSAVSKNRVSLQFTESVSLSRLVITGSDGTLTAVPEYSEDNRRVDCILQQAMKTGLPYTMRGEITDCAGNTLDFSISVSGYNDHPARLLLSEIQDGKASSKNLKYEFAELYVLKSGCLSGLELYSANDGTGTVYRFPNIEVSRGDYIILHMRTDETGGCTDETADDLTLSFAVSSCSTARDLWAENDKARFGSTADVIMIRDSNTGAVQDALVYTKSGRADWPKEEIKTAAQAAYESGIWTAGSGPEHAVQMEKKSPPYIFVRIDIGSAVSGYSGQGAVPVSAADWTLVTPSHATPGVSNTL